MDLDAGINAVLERVEKTGSLDVQDEYFFKHFDIYTEIDSINDAILKSGYTGTTVSYFGEYDKILDVESLLKIKNDYDFLESVFMNFFGRVCESKTLAGILKRFKEKSLTREEYLKILEKSEEAQEKNIYLTGFSKFEVDEFKEFTDRDFVKRAFVRILKRYADSHGLKDFTLKLKTGVLTRNEVIDKIIFSNEAKMLKVPKVIFSNNNENENQKLKSKKCGLLKRNNTRDGINEFDIHKVINEDYDEFDKLEECYNNARKDIRNLSVMLSNLIAEVNVLKDKL
ncbi:MAG: DUF4214 domain-containing protein [Bdellovibrionota bacterium]